MFRVRLFSVLALCAAGLVSTSTASAQAKIAFVNWQKALLGTQEFKKIVADLTAKYKPRQDALEKAQRDLADIQTQLQSSQGKLSAVGQADLDSQGQRKQREVERLTQDLQDDTEKDRNELVQRVGSRMTEVLNKIRDEKGLDAVLDTAGAVSVKPGIELTDEAIAAYDKAYPLKP
jgi:outer membrane protein